jgi:FKBP-type peptidyl-prolyl cis-trans isomerase
MFPHWLSWLFVLLMGYLIYTNTRSYSAPAETPSPESSAASSYPALQQLTNGDRWKRAMNPGHVGTTKINDTTMGTGATAQCGARVTIRLRGTLADGTNFDAAHNAAQPLDFVLGNAPYAVLNQALVGMRQGGVRQISAPPQSVYPKGAHKTRDDVLLRVELDEVVDPIAP